jgi:hypothetical protein
VETLSRPAPITEPAASAAAGNPAETALLGNFVAIYFKV